MPRFYLDEHAEVTQKEILLSEKESRHALKVLRLKAGQVVEAVDGKGKAYAGHIAAVRQGRVAVAVHRVSQTGPGALARIGLALSVVRPERMDWIVEKSCELGVSDIYPIVTERCIIRLTQERWALKEKHWQKTIAESCKQCGRSLFPKLHPVRKFSGLADWKERFERILIPTLGAKGRSIGLAVTGNESAVMVMIGPEGDFTPAEIERSTGEGAVPIDLGSSVMRSETASLYAVSVVRFLLEEKCGRRFDAPGPDGRTCCGKD